MANSCLMPEDEISRFAPVVLEVSELLEHRPADATALSFKEREIIREGLEYLELIMTGQDVVQEAGASIVARDDSLSAYEETSRALLWAHSPSAVPAEKRKLFITSQSVLMDLKAGKPLRELDPDAVEQTRSFFRMLEEYQFSGRFSHASSIFDLAHDLGKE